MSAVEEARDLSVVVFGATGVTGRLVAAHLSERAGEVGVRWAAAARDPAKASRVLEELSASAPEMIAADIEDRDSLREMASRCRVVLNLVGPYTRYGEPVIEACIAAGAHYVDLTGEMPFVRRMIDRHQEAAVSAGVKVVNTSGFEALPADLAVLLAAETARERWREPLASVDVEAHLPTPEGGAGASEILSGGTLQSSAESVDDEAAELVVDPAALIEDPGLAARVRQVSPITLAPRSNAEGEVIGPMLPTPFINPAVIHRSAAILAAESGRASEPFRYREGIATPGGPAAVRYALAAGSAGFQLGYRALMRARPEVRHRAAALMRKALPASGFGPSGERLKLWRWRLAVSAVTTGGNHVNVDLDAEGYPGYLSTGRMMGEAGLLLAQEGATPERSGFLTPATAIGSERLDSFEHAGMRFRVSS